MKELPSNWPGAKLSCSQVVALELRSKAASDSVLPAPEDEMDYAAVLNRLLPPAIRVLGWCDAAAEFHARWV